MNAAVLHALNESPRCERFSEPIAEENEVIVHVRAAALKPVDKQMANGSHYAAFRELPVVCGTDGVGCLDDGTRVFFTQPRLPYGSMAQRSIVSRSHSFPIPDNIDDDIAAAIVNPGLSAWGALAWRAQLRAGETVLILGATGATGKLAVQTAKLLDAGRVDAAGRNEKVLSALHDLGADSTIRLDKTGQELTEAFAREAGDTGFDVIIIIITAHRHRASSAKRSRGELARGPARLENGSSSRSRALTMGRFHL
jgi:NADPH:quinone reductase-like Zn-dependent oxidoreductase